jgi:hypothetical protein
MRDKWSGILGGGLIGLVVAGTLALPSVLPPAMADDEPIRTMLKTGVELIPSPQVDGRAFVKPDWTVEPWVSMEATSESVVRKIEFGRVTDVVVMATNTGTYSSDGLASPHIRYPGIRRGAATGPAIDAVSYWDGRWVRAKLALDASSFVTIVPFHEGSALITEDGACIETSYGIFC